MIIASHSAGLSGRIKAIVTCMKNKDFKILWNKNDVVGCNFDDLFDSTGMSIYSDGSEICDTHYELHNDWRWSDNNGSYIDVPFYYEKYNDCKKSYIPLELIQEHSSNLKKLKIKDDILQKVNEYSMDNMISVQIRTWAEGNPNQTHWCYKKANKRRMRYNIDKYTKVMDSFKNKNFFITTDDYSIIDTLISKYGKDRIITRDISLNRDRVSVDGMKNIFIDMLISSKNKILVGDYKSSFTELTWWYGGCNSELILIK